MDALKNRRAKSFKKINSYYKEVKTIVNIKQNHWLILPIKKCINHLKSFNLYCQKNGIVGTVIELWTGLWTEGW